MRAHADGRPTFERGSFPACAGGNGPRNRSVDSLRSASQGVYSTTRQRLLAVGRTSFLKSLLKGRSIPASRVRYRARANTASGPNLGLRKRVHSGVAAAAIPQRAGPAEVERAAAGPPLQFLVGPMQQRRPVS